MTLLSSRTTAAGPGGPGRVRRPYRGQGRGNGTGGPPRGGRGFLGPVPPSKPILSRAEEDCPLALYFGVGGGVCNETQFWVCEEIDATKRKSLKWKVLH